jgi:hypothetical protein
MNKKRQQAAKTNTIPSQAALLKLLADAGIQRDKSRLSRWIADDRWTFGDAPWPAARLPDIIRWIGENLDDDDTSTNPELLALRKAKLVEETRRLAALASSAELELAEQRGELMPRAEVEHGRIDRVQAVMQAMKSAGSRLADKLDGIQDRPQIARIVEDEMRYVASTFANEGEDASK